MTYYTLPLITGIINSSNFKIKFNDNNKECMNRTLAKYLTQIKGQIDKHGEDWDYIKSYFYPALNIYIRCFPSSKYLTRK